MTQILQELKTPQDVRKLTVRDLETDRKSVV